MAGISRFSYRISSVSLRHRIWVHKLRSYKTTWWTSSQSQPNLARSFNDLSRRRRFQLASSRCCFPTRGFVRLEFFRVKNVEKGLLKLEICVFYSLILFLFLIRGLLSKAKRRGLIWVLTSHHAVVLLTHQSGQVSSAAKGAVTPSAKGMIAQCVSKAPTKTFTWLRFMMISNK